MQLVLSIFFYLHVIDYKPRNYEELFNLWHAQLRDVIEHILSVMKKCFKVLLLVQKYSFASQAQIVPALVALHNTITIHNPSNIPC